MKNGDHMTCEVKGLDTGVLYVSFDYIDGTASVDWSKVARLESKQPFIVKTEDGTVYTGMIRTEETAGERPVKIEVVEDDAHEIEIDRSKIIGMTGIADKFWDRFNGQVNFGINYSKGNQSTQFSFGSQTDYVRERWSAGINFDSNLASSAGANASTRNSLNVTVLRLLRQNNWFYAGVGRSSAELGTRNLTSERPGRWRGQIFEEHEPDEHLRSRWGSLADHNL